ncbi:MAG: LCP family protein [Firmicutes bacterium]|jgi:anionic cell wall polymer biosynthesis LytR-Cps2A-Psr (LCP) family protein|nr:LCP family protein [Bacillota bacterium]
MKLFTLRGRHKSGKAIRRKNRAVFLIIFVLFLAVLFVGVRFLGSFQALQNKEPWAKALRTNPQDEGTNYLLYGLAEIDDEKLIEELFFLNIDPSSDSFNAIFIPGNLLLRRSDGKETEAVSGNEAPEENNLTSYYTPTNFYQDGGAELLVNQLSSFLGVPIHHFLEIEYKGIPILIDDRGGISYKGYVLNGEDYLDYFLHGEGEEEPLKRALRRTKSLQGLVEFAAEKGGIWSTPRLLRKISPYLDTDLSWKELQNFYPLLEPLFDPGTFVVQLPGVLREINGEPFFEPDYGQVAVIMENLGEDFILPRDSITVEVLNGCGTKGIAARLADMLRDKGFRIEMENVGNADRFDYQHTQVISRIDDMSAAKQVAEMVRGAELIKEPLVDYPVMVTVIIGQDFSF